MKNIQLFFVKIYAFVICPFILFIQIAPASWYIHLITIIWIVLLISIALFFKRAFGAMIITILVYSFMFSYWYANNLLNINFCDGEIVDAIFMFFNATFASLSILYFSFKIRLNIDSKKEEQEARLINAVKHKIEDAEIEIKRLETTLFEKQEIINLLDLISSCNTDISAIYNNPKYNNIKQLTDEIESRKKIIRVLSDEIQKNSHG